MSDLVPVQVKGNVGTIDDNLDLVEISIREKVAEYSAVVVTEDGVKDGKRFLADIRKEKKALDDERKSIKRQWMAPYEEFEKRANQIIALYDEPVKIINDQLNEFEKQRREMKRQEIEAAYDFVKGNLADWLPLDRIYNPKWENATYSSKKVREEMELIFDQMKVSISTIKSMKSEFEADALRVLKETGSLQNAIAEINELQKQKERFMERARQEAERERLEKERAEKEQEEKTAALQNAEEKTVGPETNEKSEVLAFDITEEIHEPLEPFAPEKILTVMVKIGENDIGMLREFLDMANLEYEVME
ncbi:DUF1351 domain-containing protein [Parablautia sp. Marseille-Q6255]|uniref:DUF1351 domain-containing protein n=1 Tax=Parablautia sp. Marseille-Q6255 TaxID=3039593 RepID=UPI0024BC7518|nr:DUF1351 domain-containing protein [Parablautia sp. Marseille-Q6255]